MEKFEELTRRYPEAIELHTKNNNWPNVLQHCLLEAVRAEIFAELLGFDEALKNDVITASLVHDAYKRQEVELTRAEMKAGGTGLAAIISAGEAALRQLEEQGFNERVRWFVGLVGGSESTMLEIFRILRQEAHTDEQLAALIVHYIDDYTIDAAAVSPAEHEPVLINDIDRRAFANMNKPQYAGINAEWMKQYSHHSEFAGKNSFEVMVQASHQIEKLLVPYFGAASKQVIDPIDIPEFIEKRRLER